MICFPFLWFSIMFRNPPFLHLVVAKKNHHLIAILATSLLLLGTISISLCLGTDHWREFIANNHIHVIQGLREECDKSTIIIKCLSITRSKFTFGLLGHLEIIYGLLVEAVVLNILCNVASLTASLHKRSILVTAVLAIEITSVLMTSLALACFTVIFLKNPWKAGWSYYTAWFSLASVASAACLHYIVQDVKFLGKRLCK